MSYGIFSEALLTKKYNFGDFIAYTIVYLVLYNAHDKIVYYNRMLHHIGPNLIFLLVQEWFLLKT